MSWLLVLWVLANAALFLVLLGYALGLQRRWRSTSIRFIATALVLVSGVFLVSSVQRLGVQAANAGLIEAGWGDFFLTEFQLVLSFVGTLAGLYAITRLRSGIRQIEDGERMLTVLTDRIGGDVDTSNWQLTARELDVLKTIVAGHTSDNEIAEALYISSATAGTHVRNILRKTGLSSRMDLMLVGGRGIRDKTPGRENPGEGA